MSASIFLLSCALAAGQVGEPNGTAASATAGSAVALAPRLAKGLELVYSGTYVEEDLSPNVSHERRYRLDTTMFVLDAGPRRWDVAFLTTFSVRDTNAPDAGTRNAAVPGAGKRDMAYGPRPGARPEASVRLELGAIDGQGRLSLGAAPELATHAARPIMPVWGPPTLECGMVVEAPVTRVARNQFWEVSEEGRPPRSWQIIGQEASGGTTCLKLVGTQQSDDWDRPRGDHAAWRRRDTVWLIPKLGVAHQVERIVERRDPARRDPTQRTTIRYELDSRLQYPGGLFEDRRTDILKTKKFQDDAGPLLAQPGLYRPQIEALTRRIAYYLNSQAATPYRKALLALQGRLASAYKGEALGAPPALGAAVDEAVFATAVAVGQRVPDFVVADLTGKESARLSRLLGRPVLVFFYNPATATGKDVLLFASALQQKHGARLAIMAMAVTSEPAVARQQHAELRLPFPVLDGSGLHLTFGVERTPRLIVLDAEGTLRLATTGWGSHSAREIEAELLRCLPK